MENKFQLKKGKNLSSTAADSLFSDDTVEVLLGLCEGEIEGLKDGGKSFYLDNTPLINDNGTNNFENFNLEILPGSGVDEEVKFSLVGSTRSNTVGVELTKDKALVRSTQGGNIDFIELRFVVQSLYYTKTGTKGSQISAATAVFKIEYKKSTDEEWKNVFPEDENLQITGKTTTTFVRELRWPVEQVEGTYDVRVTKLSEDTETGGGSGVTSCISWESMQEINATIRSFPHTALAHLTCQATDQFSSIPEFSGVYKLLKIKIPSNYDPIAKTYDGIWDGTFKIAWSDNPAWCLYDLIMNDRYGCRAYSDVELDKWDTYEAGQWCDELVSDGHGGKQPRYTFNTLISDIRNGKNQINYVAASFNAVLYEEATGYLRLKIDKDQDAIMLFTPENIVEGSLTYSFTEPENRFNEITTAFTNPDLNWDTDVRQISNNDDIIRNGRVTEDFVAVGCIYEGEALRRAYYRMITCLTEKLIVSFNTNRLAQALSVWDIILLSDPTLGYALSGRIKDVEEDRHYVNLRDALYLEAGIDYKVEFTSPEGIYETEINPLTGSGNIYQLNLKEPLPDNIPEKSVFTVYGTAKTGTPKPFRVTNIKESGSDEYTVTAIEINRNKWKAADNLEFVGGDEYSGLPNVDDIPYALSVDFSEFYDSDKVEFSLLVSAELDTNAYPYYSGELVVYSREVGQDTWIRRNVINNNVIVGHPSGCYEFVVLPKNLLGNTPPFDNAPRYFYEVSNISDPPADVKNFKAEQTLEGTMLSWDPNTDIDLVGYEIREGPSWDEAEVISTKYNGNTLFVYIQDTEKHTYLIKAIDALDNYSINAAAVTVVAKEPENVPNFWITTNNDYMRFDWEEVPGIDIVYVIKRGDSWESGIELLRTKGNNATVLMPANPNTYFSIKALTPAGLYSLKPRYARPDLALDPNRNVIIEIDNSKDGFPGVTYGFKPHETLPEVMVMEDSAVFAEHYFPVNLLKEVRARNWLETQAFVFGKRLTWNDLHYKYTDPEAHVTWINSDELGDSGSIKTIIATKSTKPYEGLLGFPLSEDFWDMNRKVNASIVNGATFSTGRLTNGLYIQSNTQVIYNDVTIPEVFSFSIRVRVTDDTPNNFYILRLTNSKTTESMFLYNLEGTLVLTVSDGQSLRVPIKWVKGLDFLTIVVVQSETTRTVFFKSDYSDYQQIASLEAKPIGEFTSINIGV